MFPNFLEGDSMGGRALKKSKDEIFAKDTGEGDRVISRMEGMNAAIGTTVEVGNIGGEASSIALGGPGSIVGCG